MDRRGLWVALGLWLATCTALVIYFDVLAITALFHVGSDAAGQAVLQAGPDSNTIFPFTYIGAGLSALGVAICVYRQERAALSVPAAGLIGVLVGNIAAIGTLVWFEEAFLVLRTFTAWNHSAAVYWLTQNWANTATGAGLTVGAMLLALVVLPWSRRRNWPGVVACLVGYGVFMGLWFANGFADPQSGDLLDYLLNAGARVASQLAVVAAVLPQDVVGALRSAMSRVRSRRRVQGADGAETELSVRL